MEKLDYKMERSGCKRDCWENKKAKSESTLANLESILAKQETLQRQVMRESTKETCLPCEQERECMGRKENQDFHVEVTMRERNLQETYHSHLKRRRVRRPSDQESFHCQMKETMQLHRQVSPEPTRVSFEETLQRASLLLQRIFQPLLRRQTYQACSLGSQYHAYTCQGREALRRIPFPF